MTRLKVAEPVIESRHPGGNAPEVSTTAGEVPESLYANASTSS